MMNHTSGIQTPVRVSRSPGLHRYTLFRRAGLGVPLAAVLVLAAGCGSTQSAPTTTRATSTGSGISIKSMTLASATLPGVGAVLTGPSGRTLYLFTADSSDATSCTGQCAVVWPPLVVSSGTRPALASGVPGTLGTAMRPGGSSQVTYDGHRLYYYEGDTAAGQDKGQGLEGSWFVVSTSPTSTAGTPTTTSPGGGGGGVGF